jgi:hypothetical protein
MTKKKLDESQKALKRALALCRTVKFTASPNKQWTTLEEFFQWMRDLDAEATRRDVNVIADQVCSLSYWVEFFQNGWSVVETVDYFLESGEEGSPRDPNEVPIEPTMEVVMTKKRTIEFKPATAEDIAEEIGRMYQTVDILLDIESGRITSLDALAARLKKESRLRNRMIKAAIKSGTLPYIDGCFIYLKGS